VHPFSKSKISANQDIITMSGRQVWVPSSNTPQSNSTSQEQPSVNEFTQERNLDANPTATQTTSTRGNRRKRGNNRKPNPTSNQTNQANPSDQSTQPSTRGRGSNQPRNSNRKPRGSNTNKAQNQKSVNTNDSDVNTTTTTEESSVNDNVEIKVLFTFPNQICVI
jgi:hypothetical protein